MYATINCLGHEDLGKHPKEVSIINHFLVLSFLAITSDAGDADQGDSSASSATNTAMANSYGDNTRLCAKIGNLTDDKGV